VKLCLPPLDGSDEHVKLLEFLPEYGCSVLAIADDLTFADTVGLFILALDPHEFGIHNGRGCGKYDYYGRATNFKTILLGGVAQSDLDDIMDRFQRLLLERQNRQGRDRSAAGGNQGHQFTPVMIQALLLQALCCGCKNECMCNDVLPKGGMTDNGLHTGGNPRNTCFPLSYSLLRWKLKEVGDADGSLYLRLATFIHLQLAEWWFSQQCGSEIDSFDPSHFGKLRMDVDNTLQILEDAALSFEGLDESRFALESFYDQASRLKKSTRSLLIRLDDLEAKSFLLENLESELQHLDAFTNPILHLDRQSKFRANISIVDDCRRLAAENIGGLPILRVSKSPIDGSDLLSWCSSSNLKWKARVEDAWLVVRYEIDGTILFFDAYENSMRSCFRSRQDY